MAKNQEPNILAYAVTSDDGPKTETLKPVNSLTRFFWGAKNAKKF
jgi:hypothetical protein